MIQKYIEKPLLFKGFKFDIRAFGLLTQDMELYVSRYLQFTSESYIRLSSLAYDLSRMNYFIHFTNNAVQVKSDSYGSVVKGNIMSISDFEVGKLNPLDCIKGRMETQKTRIQ